MKIDTRTMMSLSEANQNFSKVAKKVDALGEIVVLKNNKPKYVVVDFEDYLNLTENERLEIIAKRIIAKYKKAFEELGK